MNTSDIKTFQIFEDTDPRYYEVMGRVRLVRVVSVENGKAFVESTTNKPDRLTSISLERLTNEKLYKPYHGVFKRF